MSSESLAAFRRNVGAEYAELAQKHIEHDLKPEDRERLESAARTFSMWTAVGSVIGLGLGAFVALRVRSARSRAYQAIRAAERPTHVQFKDGRTEPIPDITPFLRPSTLGDIAAYTLFGAGGLFIGGELGVLGGGFRATSKISSDPNARQRIERAFRSFRADVLRKEAERLEAGQSAVGF